MSSSREQGKQGVTLDRIKPRQVELNCKHILEFTIVPERREVIYCPRCKDYRTVRWVEPKNASP